jgi:hypothetical protein
MVVFALSLVRSKLVILGFHLSEGFGDHLPSQYCDHVVFVFDTTAHRPPPYDQPNFSHDTGHSRKARQDELRVIPQRREWSLFGTLGRSDKQRKEALGPAKRL